MAQPLITISNLDYCIRGRSILHNITLEITAGTLLTIVGPNGAGKSTLLKLILGQLAPSSGNIKRKKALKMAYLPQKFQPPADLPISMRRFLRDIPNADKADVLQTLSIQHLLDTPLQMLSGGETQRLLLARAFLLQPDLIVLDEPAAGIDPTAIDHYYAVIRAMQLRYQCAIVMVSHDLHLVMAASDRVICINRHICCQGHPQEIMHHPEFVHLSEHTIGFYSHHHQHTHL